MTDQTQPTPEQMERARRIAEKHLQNTFFDAGVVQRYTSIALTAILQSDQELAELRKHAEAMAEALERCAVIVDRNNWRQNEKVDDVKLIAREASSAYRQYQEGRTDG